MLSRGQVGCTVLCPKRLSKNLFLGGRKRITLTGHARAHISMSRNSQDHQVTSFDNNLKSYFPFSSEDSKADPSLESASKVVMCCCAPFKDRFVARVFFLCQPPYISTPPTASASGSPLSNRSVFFGHSRPGPISNHIHHSICNSLPFR